MKCFFFSLKYYQLGVFLCRKEYSFEYSKHMKTPVDTFDLIEKLDDFTRLDWFKDQHASLNNREVEFRKIVALPGNCFNVNMKSNVFRPDA
jgi:hypothetical protein